MVSQNYDFEINKITKIIKKLKPKSILIQLPDGLKPEATFIADKLKESGAQIYIWAGTCFGACDIPNIKFVDLIVQFGHNKFRQLG